MATRASLLVTLSLCLLSAAASAEHFDLAPPDFGPDPLPPDAVVYDLAAMSTRTAALQLYELYHRRTPYLERQFALPALSAAGPEWAVLGGDYLRYLRAQPPLESLDQAVETHLVEDVGEVACDGGISLFHSLRDGGGALIVADRLSHPATLALGRFTVSWEATCEVFQPIGQVANSYDCTIDWTLRDRFAFADSDAERLLNAAPFGVHAQWRTRINGQTVADCAVDAEARAEVAAAAGAGQRPIDDRRVVATRSETQVAIRTANGHFLVAVGGGGGSLDANRLAVNAWETFTLVAQDDGTVSLRSANGRYVTALNGGGAEVFADRWAAGPWERFTPTIRPDGTVHLQTADGHYLVAEGGGGGALNADRGSVDGAGAADAVFTFVPVPAMRMGLMTHDGRFVTAIDGGGRHTAADRPELGPWETFTLTEQNFTRFALQAASGHYVAAEPNGDVFANRGAVGPWELFARSTAPEGRTLIRSAHGPLTADQGVLYNSPETGNVNQHFRFVQLPGLFHDWSHGDPDVEAFAPMAGEPDLDLACRAALPMGSACARIDIAVADGLRPEPVEAGRRYCVCPPAEVDRVELTIDADVLDPGETTRLSATAFDRAGRPLIAHPFVPLEATGLPITEWVATGVTPGDYFLTAMAGGVTSDVKYILVDDPRDRLWRRLDGRVAFPEGLAPAAAFVVGPDDTRVPLAAGGRFQLDVKRYRNQRVQVIDAATEAPLLWGIARGSIDGEPDEVLTLDIASTAEALVFLAPSTADPDPEALLGFRALLAQVPAVAELESRLLSVWSAAGSPMAEPSRIGPAVEAVATDAAEAARRLLDPETAGDAGSIISAPERIYHPTLRAGEVGPQLAFDPQVFPSSGSRIYPEIVGREGRIVQVQFSNRLVRRLDLYLEEVPPGGGRAPSARARRLVGALTFLPTVGKLIAGQLLRGNPFSEFLAPGSTSFKLALPPGSRWRVFAYGPGARGDNVPRGLRDPLPTFVARIAHPTARTLMFDYIGNAISVVSTVDKAAFKADLAKAADVFAAVIVAGAGVEAGVRLRDGAEVEFIASLISQAQATLESVAKAIGSEALQKLTGVLDGYDAIVAFTDLALARASFARAHTAEMFTVLDAAGAILPADGPDGSVDLADGTIDCAYEQTLRVEGGLGPFQWKITKVFPTPLNLQVVGPTDQRQLTVRIPRFPGLRVAFDAEVTEAGRKFATRQFVVKGYLATPEITDVRFPQHGAGALPGDEVPVRVQVKDCRGFGERLDGDVSGPGLIGRAPLGPAGIIIPGDTEAWLGATVVLENVLQDRPVARATEQVDVRVTHNGRTGKRRAHLDIRNVAPTNIRGGEAVYRVLPGGMLPLTIQGFDRNWGADPRPEVLAAGVSALDVGDDLRTVPPLSTLTWAQTRHAADSGAFTFTPTIGSVTVASRHPDNDGPTAATLDDRPEPVPLLVVDDNGEVESGFAQVVVRNVAPSVEAIALSPPLLPAARPGVPNPLTITATVDDQNGLDDIGRVEVVVAPGQPPMEMTNPSGDKRTFIWRTDNFVQDCRGGCPIEVRAIDADDLEGNGHLGLALQNLGQRDDALEVIADGAEFADQSDRSQANTAACTRQLVRFSVRASGPDGTSVRATLRFDGTSFPMVAGPNGSFLADVPMPAAPNRYRYDFEIDEVPQGRTAVSEARFIEVIACEDPDLSRGPCAPEVARPEVCNGLDDNCNGVVDDGLNCDPAEEPDAPEARCGDPIEFADEGTLVAAGPEGRFLVAGDESLRLIDPETCEEERALLEARPVALAFDGTYIAYVERGVVYAGPFGERPQPVVEGVDAEAGFGVVGGRLLTVSPTVRGPLLEVIDLREHERLVELLLTPASTAALGETLIIISDQTSAQLLPLPGVEGAFDGQLEKITPDLHAVDAVRAIDGTASWMGQGREGPTLGIVGPALEPIKRVFEPNTADAWADARSVMWIEVGEGGERLLIQDHRDGEPLELAAHPGPIESPMLLRRHIAWREDGALRWVERPAGR